MTAPLRALLLALTLLVAAVPVATAHDNDKRKRSRPAVSGQTTLALSDEAAKALGDAGITATPVAPATTADGGFTFPVKKLRAHRRNLKLKHDGGLTLTKGTTSVTLTDLVVRAHRRRAKLFAEAGDDRFPLAKLRNLRAQRGEGTLTVTADAFLTKSAAKGLNQTFGTAFAGGEAIGTLTTQLKKG